MQKRASVALALLPLLIVAVFVVLAPSARAQTAAGVDTSGWKCERCPFDEGKLDADVEAGAQYVDGTDAKFGNFTGLDEDGGYAILDGTAGAHHANGTYWMVTGRDLGLDARAVTVEGGQAGSAQLSLEYAQLPHTIFDTTATPFTHSGAETLV
jgi:hypothetical protein